MKVKQKYSFLSEQIMYEWTLEQETPYNRAKRRYYAFWHSIKNLDVSELTFDDLTRMAKIEEIHMRECKRPRFKKR